MNAASALAVDPSSGFLESTGNFANAFDSERKAQFLEVYKANGLRFKKTCKLLGISEHTINHHHAVDHVFRSAFDEVQREYAEDLQCTSMEIALTPKGFMDRIAQLRRLFPGKYAPAENTGQTKIELHIDGDVMISKKNLETMETTIVGEIESDSMAAPAIMPHTPPQTLDVPSETHSISVERGEEGRPQ